MLFYSSKWSWLRFLFRPDKPSARHGRRVRASHQTSQLFRSAETLEPICLLSSITVTTLADEVATDGAVSLREAVQAANTDASVDGSEAGSGTDSIVFATGLTGTISLQLGQLSIASSMSITGPGMDLLSLDGMGQSRVIDIGDGATDVSLSGLTVTGGVTRAEGLTNSDANYLAESGAGIRFQSSGTLTITGSRISSNQTFGDYAEGGGLAASTGIVVLTDSVIEDNSSEWSGGGIQSRNGDVALVRSTISGNVVNSQSATYGGDGGGISVRRGSLTLTDSVVRNNSAAGTYSNGGGIASYRGTVTLLRSTITGNTARSVAEESTEYGSHDGGGISGGAVIVTESSVTNNRVLGSGNGGGISGETITVTDSSVSDNHVISDGYGGGIYGSHVTLVRSTISRNSASGRGGGIAAESASLIDSRVSQNIAAVTRPFAYGSGGGLSIQHDNQTVIRNSTIDSNQAIGERARGGGIEFDGGLLLENSTISGNVASGRTARGGGIFAGAGDMTITHSTITGNTASGNGAFSGGIYMDDGLCTSPTNVITNSIVAANSAQSTGLSRDLAFRLPGVPNDCPIYLQVTASLIGDNTRNNLPATGPDGSQVTGNIVGRPTALIDPLLGPLQDNGGLTPTHALLPTSPAVDRGLDLSDDGFTLDQRGMPRPRQGGFDMGAVEYTPGYATPSIRATPHSQHRAIPVFDIQFDRDVYEFSVDDVLFSNGQVWNFDPIDHHTYRLTVIPLSDAPVTIEVPADVTRDGNSSATLTFPGESVRPMAQISPNGTVVSASTTVFTVDFGEPVTGLDASEFVVTNGVIRGLTQSNDQTFQLEVESTLSGMVTVTLPDGAAMDSSGNESRQATAAVLVVDTIFQLSVTLPASGNEFEILRDNADLIVREKDGSELARQLASNITILTINGSGESDSVTVLDSGIPVTTPIVFSGSNGNDRFDGTNAAGNLHLWGNAGDDVLIGGTSNDILRGGAGSDELIGSGGHDFLKGDGATGDTLEGNQGNDTLDGGAGNDVLRESVNGNAMVSSDLMTGNGTDTLIGVERVRVHGGSAAQVIDVSRFFSPGMTSATVIAGGGDDTILGSLGNDRLRGSGGDDWIDGSVGSDWLDGGSGRDRLLGGLGNDILKGQGGSGDRLTGGLGNDTLNGGRGLHRLIESADADFTLTNDSLTGIGLDVLQAIEIAQLTGGPSANRIDASAFTSARGFTRLTGNGGNDSIIGSAGRDIIRGGAGHDLIQAREGRDFVDGGSGYDRITGHAGNDVLIGSQGSDTILAGDGDDSVHGGNGDDVLLGGDGSDTITSGAGFDQISGGNFNTDHDDVLTDARSGNFADGVDPWWSPPIFHWADRW